MTPSCEPAGAIERRIEHLLDLSRPDELEVVAQVLGDVLEIRLIAARCDHARDPGPLGGQRLLLQPADRQHLAASA